MRENFMPFENAEEVWFWFCASLEARGDGLRARGDYCGEPRCCEIGDIQRIIKSMKSNNHATNRHLRVMVKYGSIMQPPYYYRSAKRSEIALWEEFVRNFEYYLQVKKIL